MSATPIATRRMVLGMKYGKTIRASPQTSGTTAFCFLPYTKKPSPTEPKSKPQRSNDVLIAVLHVAELVILLHSIYGQMSHYTDYD